MSSSYISAEVLERCAKPVEDDLFTRREMFEICDDGQCVVFNYNDLFIRPIRHWNPERVKGHMFLCMLSYMIIFEARQCFAEFLAPVGQAAKKLLAAAGAKLDRAAKRQLGLADYPRHLWRHGSALR